jgi:hypothetical protein
VALVMTERRVGVTSKPTLKLLGYFEFLLQFLP